MTDEDLLKELTEFFLDSLQEDRSATEDWVAQGDYEVHDFIAEVIERKNFRRELEWQGRK